MIFECKRCGHIETHKGNFLKHLNRKTQCKPILQDIDIETLKHELESKKPKLNLFEPKLPNLNPKLNPFEPKLNPIQPNKTNIKEYI